MHECVCDQLPVVEVGHELDAAQDLLLCLCSRDCFEAKLLVATELACAMCHYCMGQPLALPTQDKA